MAKLADGCIPADANECSIEEFRNHLLIYQQKFESYATRNIVISALCFVVAIVAVLFTTYQSFGIVILIVAAFFWIESKQHVVIVNLIAALWPLAITIKYKDSKPKKVEF